MPDSRLCSRVYPSSAWRRTTDTPLMARMVEEQEKHSTGCGHELRLKVADLSPNPKSVSFQQITDPLKPGSSSVKRRR